MNIKTCVENKENYSVELVVEVDAAEFEAAVELAYKKSRKDINVPGFRKGKAPRKVIEGMYGSAVFYQDAIEDLYPKACEEAIVEKKLDMVCPPDIEILEVGKDGMSFKAIVTIRPEVEMKDYKGMEANKVIPQVKEEAVLNELNVFVERATTLETVERPAADGDTAVIDFEGFKEGVPFNGGKGENFELVLGSHSFIPGFEEQVVGMSAGEEKELTVTFPEDYQAPDLAGKEAVFKVKLHEAKAKVVPTLDDEFAKDVSEFNTLEDLKLDIRAKLADRNLAQSEGYFKQELVNKLCQQVTISLPEGMVSEQIDKMMKDYASRLEQQGISLEMYMSYMQLSEQKMREELRGGAEQQIRTQIALDGVAKAENIVITDEEVTAELQKIADSMQLELSDIEGVLSSDIFKRDLARDRAIAFVAEHAKATLVTEEELMALTEVKAEEEAPAEAAAEEKPVKKTRTRKPAAPKAPKAETAEGEAAPKKTRRTKKATEEKAETAE